MAEPTDAPVPAIPVTISMASQKHLLSYVQKILQYHKQNSLFRVKMDAIDVAYARYVEAVKTGNTDGIDRYGQVPCGGLREEVVNPIVISNVQSMVSYWTEVFLSGYPRFPVVSMPATKNAAEALEGILQDHVTLSQSDAEFQLSFNDLAKYNLGACEVDWGPLSNYNPVINNTDPNAKAEVSYDIKHINKIKRLNLRNTFMDPLIDPARVSEDGEFIGYTEIYNRPKLKKLLNYLTNEKLLTHPSVVNKAMESPMDHTLYIKDPALSNYDTAKSESANWDIWGGFTHNVPEGMIKVPYNAQGMYAVSVVYARLIPTDHLLNVPNKNHPQIWKLRVVNGEVLISAERMSTAYDMLPIYVSQALEDGMTLQTQSYAEMTMPIQKATTRLFNIRFQAANRAIQDRGLYNPDLIRSADINSPIPSAKIPVKVQALSENPLSSAYMNLPFDARGTEGVLQDAMMISNWQKDLTGQNDVSRGQFQKGNKTQDEFNTVMGNSENRGRLSALVIAQRMFNPIKQQLKLNILQFGEDTEVISPRSNKPLELSIEELINTNLQFEVADGYTPRSKMAGTDMIMGIMNMIGTSPILQQVYGPQLPAMVAHLAQLGGVRGFDQYAETAVVEYQKQMTLQQNLVQLMQQLQQQMGGSQPGASDQPPQPQ